MARRFLQRLARHVADAVTDQVLRNVQDRIDELQGIPLLGGRSIRGIELPDATPVPVRHGLGRIPTVLISPPYFKATPAATGHVRDRTRGSLSAQFDPSLYVVLYAEDWGITAYVDLWVY